MCIFKMARRLAAIAAVTALVSACGGSGGGDDDEDTPRYTVTATAGTNGSVSPASVEVDADGTADFTITPDTNYAFDTATGTCTGIIVGDTYTTAPINADCSVEFSFVYNGPPLAPAVPSLGGQQQQFVFTWTDVADADFYRLLENPDGLSGYSQIGGDVASGVQTYSHPVTLYRRINASYILQSCNTGGCADSPPLLASDDLVSPIVYVKASNTGNGDQFGWSVALSADGTTLAVGAPLEDSNSQAIDGDENNDDAVEAGAVYVFVRSGGAWARQAYIKASDAVASHRFGYSVSLADDGNLLAVGTFNAGAVYLFTRSGDAWSDFQRLSHPDVQTPDLFGYSISLSGNGERLAIGALNDDSDGAGIDPANDNDNRLNSGAVYVYVLDGGTFANPVYIKAEIPDEGDNFGAAVSLDGDGTTLAVGAPQEDGATLDPSNNDLGNSGAAYVFQFDAGWSQQVYLKASNRGGNARFGETLDLDAAGDTLAIGAPQDNSVASQSGAAYIFQQGGPNPLIGFWLEPGPVLKAGNADLEDSFGRQVALSADGNTLAVAANGEDSSAVGVAGDQDDDSGAQSGAVYLFGFDSATWSEQAYVKARHRDDGARFGQGLALSGDGDSLAVGAHLEKGVTTGIDSAPDLVGSNNGAVFVY